MNIEQRRGLWYAVVMVPKELRATYGFKFLQSLQTRDKSEAQAKAVPIVARWKQEIKEARRQGGKGGQTTISNRTPLGPLLSEWEAYANMGKKTLDQARRDLAKLVSHFQIVEAITPKAVKIWLDDLTAAGSTHSSLNRILKACRSLWNYLRKSSTIELDRPDPFAGMLSLVASKVERNRQGRVAWEPDDLARIYQAALDKGDQPLADIIALGAYTGARIDELGSLKVVDVTRRKSLMITDSKTKAGIREIPIHPELLPLVKRLTREATSDYLIPAQAENQYDHRGDVLGKRFGRLKKSMGFAAGAQVFHSIRKTLITLMENAGVSEGVAADIVGHEKQTMTYGLYSMGSELEIKRVALASVLYPTPLTNIK